MIFERFLNIVLKGRYLKLKYHKDMEIFIVGGGEIGKALAVQLSRDGYELTIIDREESVVNSIGNTVDVISYQGNGASYTTLKELGADITWDEHPDYGHEWRFWNMEVEKFLDWLPRTDGYAAAGKRQI